MNRFNYIFLKFGENSILNFNKMRKIITKYGLISGAISAVLLLIVSILNKDKFNFEYSMAIGYACMIAAMTFVYFGIKKYRDEKSEGKISFKTAFLIGLGISLISCILYSLMWLIVYYNLMPNFMDDYAKFSLQKMQNSGASQVEIDKTITAMEEYKEWYKNPILIFLLTMMEPTPVGLVISLISALILKKK